MKPNKSCSIRTDDGWRYTEYIYMKVTISSLLIWMQPVDYHFNQQHGKLYFWVMAGLAIGFVSLEVAKLKFTQDRNVFCNPTRSCEMLNFLHRAILSN